jgi:hypothetical protein
MEAEESAAALEDVIDLLLSTETLDGQVRRQAPEAELSADVAPDQSADATTGGVTTMGGVTVGVIMGWAKPPARAGPATSRAAVAVRAERRSMAEDL